MQDNYPNIDKKFTDKGWAAMRDLLDEEMPVTAPPEKKRRRWMLFLLLFGIGLGVAIGVVAGSLYFMENEVKEVQNAVIEQPIAEENAATNLERKASLETDEADAILDENKESKTVDILNNAALNQEKSVEAATDFNNKNKDEKAKRLLEEKKFFESINGIHNRVTSMEDVKIALAQIDLDEQVEDFRKKAEDFNFVNVHGETAGKQEINYLKINGLNELEIIASIPNFAMNLPELELENEDDDKKTTKNKARFGVEIAGQGAPNFEGVSAGLVYAVPLKNKWSLQTGVNYQYQRRTFSGTPIVADVTNSFENYPGLDDEIIQGAYEENSARSDSAIFTIPQNLSFQYLNIPLRVNYQLTDKWSIGSGLTGSLLLYARNDYTDGGILNDNADGFLFSDDLGVAGAGQGTNEFLKSIDRANLRNFDVAATAGIAFHPSPKWSIAANYHHGFVNYFKYSSDKKYNRYANLSLQYHFGK